MPVARDVVFFFHLFALDGNSHFAAAFIALKLDTTTNFGHRCRLFGLSCLKDFGNSRQTAGNILRTTLASRLTGKELTGLNLLTFVNFDTSLCRQVVNVKNFAVIIFDNNLRMFIALVFDNNRSAFLAFTFFFDAHRLAFDNVNKASNTGHFGQNRNSVRVPAIQARSSRNGLAVFHMNNSAVRHFEFIVLATSVVNDSQFAASLERDKRFCAVFVFHRHDVNVAILNNAVSRSLLVVFKNCARCDTARVERTHRKLRAWFAD